MSATPIARCVTERQLQQDAARSCIVCVTRASECAEHGAYLPTPLTPPSPYSTLCYVPMPEASISLYREEELQGLQKRITRKNKGEMRNPTGVTERVTEGLRGWLRLGVLPACYPYRPNNPRACVDTSSNNDRLELAGLSVQSLRAEPALALAPAVIFTDPCRHARRHARKHACSVLITKRRSGAITPDRQPVPSVRSVGDGGGRGKKRSVPGYAPLYVHNFFGIDEAGRCTNP